MIFPLTLVLHANWSGGRLHLWAEDAGAYARSSRSGEPGRGAAPGETADHPFAASAAALGELAERLSGSQARPGSITLLVPCVEGAPLPSPRLAHASGVTEEWQAAALAPVRVRSASIAPADVCRVIDAAWAVEGFAGAAPVLPGASIGYWSAASRLVRHLLARQRFVPSLRQTPAGELSGVWQPWVSDEETAARARALCDAMPGSARAVMDEFGQQPWPILEDFLTRVLDAECRQIAAIEKLDAALADRSPTDLHVAWLSGLLTPTERLPDAEGPLTSLTMRQELARRVRIWLGRLEDKGPSSQWRLCLKLSEPEDPRLNEDANATPERLDWPLTFHLQSVDRPSVLLDAEDIWLLPGESANVRGLRVDRPQELLLKELARAARLYPRLESSLEDERPTGIELTTPQAYQFLRETRLILGEQGFAVIAPAWWDSPAARLGARLKLESDEQMPAALDAPPGAPAGPSRVGMSALVRYRWEIALGDLPLTLREFETLAERKSPLVRVNGRWVEIRPEDLQAAVKFLHANPGGEVSLGEAMRLAYASDPRQTGIPVVGMEPTGWLAAFMNAESASQQIRMLEPPAGFHGTLRPYQLRGLSWMRFMENLGFGLCLADDMGLGKTIQLLALLALEREAEALTPGAERRPTLLVAPMSVVGNWMYETRRFCPQLSVVVHHGTDRASEADFAQRASRADLVITTYALSHRDRELLGRVSWGRLVLDEAQYIKNPTTKQAQAVRGIDAPRRIALTGTPVENRLSELWSIMDFLNPGYLGSAGGFRQRFAVAIERGKDRARAEQLRGLIRPFVLRRLKTDPTVIADLPEKLETREFCHLTSEQAALYETAVRRLLSEVDEVEGIQRRGLVLATLIRLKQICNHPAHLLKENQQRDAAMKAGQPVGPWPPEPSRSGKCIRMVEMLDTILGEGEKALVFTQFRQMGEILSAMLRQALDREMLFLHGGTTTHQRQSLVSEFQAGSSRYPVLILSLKAGGVGLNLTAATHVFHFDRWWNPAVENQATDRAYRIGQTRTVQVHKFVVRGTLEERIDQMIEEKTELADNIIGAGERALTELSTGQLRDLLTLRNEAVADEV
jgi:SNF2 family DNA or RNA helicase